MSDLKHFLDLNELDSETLRGILETAKRIKAAGNKCDTSLAGKTLAMIFEKPSTRTRVSFEVGMQELGGRVINLDGNSSQLGRGETIADTARVLSRFVDAIMIRTDEPDKLQDLAFYADVPVINGLTDSSHPCQIMADIMTYEEHRGSIEGKTVAWVGDGNNVAASFVHAAARFGFKLNLASPEDLTIPQDVIEWALAEKADVNTMTDPVQAVADADLILTDTWVSMGDTNAEERIRLLTPYQVNDELMAEAAKDALFMHCLPAHRNEEVTDAVIDGAQSVVWDEAENRLHAQKGILTWCLT